MFPCSHGLMFRNWGARLNREDPFKASRSQNDSQMLGEDLVVVV